MEYVPYPKWLYRTGESRLVQDKAEHELLGAGWYESPADVPAVAPAPAADEAHAEDAPKHKGKLKSLLTGKE